MLRSSFVTFETSVDNTQGYNNILPYQRVSRCQEMAKTITSGYDDVIECDNRVFDQSSQTSLTS